MSIRFLKETYFVIPCTRLTEEAGIVLRIQKIVHELLSIVKTQCNILKTITSEYACAVS